MTNGFPPYIFGSEVGVRSQSALIQNTQFGALHVYGVFEPHVDASCGLIATGLICAMVETTTPDVATATVTIVGRVNFIFRKDENKN